MEKYIVRRQKEIIEKCLKDFPVLLLTGARQTGKTTLLQNEFSSYSYVTLDDESERLYAQNDPMGFLNDLQVPVIIDEFQYAPEILHEIKKRVDATKQEPGQYLLTGSQRFEIMKGITESLAGRIAILQLPPLSQSELIADIKESVLFSDSNMTNFSYTKDETIASILQCMYPKTVSISQLKIWYESYVQTYIDRDVTQLVNIKDKGKFKKFFLILAGRVGQVLNHAELAREVGVDTKTIMSWVHILEMSDIIYLLYPWHSREGSKVIKSPKIHFMDTGLCCYLNNIHTVKKLKASDRIGFLFENMIVSEVVKSFWNRGERARCNFWRTYRNEEVDLIVETDEDLIAIEFKMTETPQKKHIKHLNKFMDLYPECTQAYVVSNVQKKQKVQSNITYVNAAHVV
jgi:uncharacterized protein